MLVAKKTLFAMLLLMFVAIAKAGEKLPVETFAALPEMEGAELSPDGMRVAAVLNKGSESFLVARDVASQDIKVLAKVDNHKISINWFRWAKADRVVLSTRVADYRNGREIIMHRLISIKYDGSGIINLVEPDPTVDLFPSLTLIPQFQDNVVDWLPDDPDNILLAIDMEYCNAPTVYKININTGSRQPIQRFQVGVVKWFTDRQHRVRVGVKSYDAKKEVIFFDVDANKWKTAWKYEALGVDAIEPVGFGADPNILYVIAYRKDYKALYTVDLRDPALPLNLKYSSPDRDFSGDLVYSERAGDVVGVSDKGKYVFWDDNLKGLASGIEKIFPNANNTITSLSRDETRYILYSGSPSKPGVYYLGDRKTKQLSPFGDTYSALTDVGLPERKTIYYKARDGINIEAFLTLPVNIEPKALPTVIIPYRGVLAENDTDFDYWAEFLANRGYAVLEMDFRGSLGHGFDFMKAGLKQFGLGMQDDLTDGTQWIIEKGIADKSRICIVGAGYGGYSTLMGVAKNGDLYRCAVSFAGVSDLQSMASRANKFSNASVVQQKIGNDWSDKDQLRATSPQFLIEQIHAPILLVHGSEDRIVPVTQSRNMADALKKAGKPYRYVELEGGDHRLSVYEHRLRLFQEMDKFLSENLGASAPTIILNTSVPE